MTKQELLDELAEYRALAKTHIEIMDSNKQVITDLHKEAKMLRKYIAGLEGAKKIEKLALAFVDAVIEAQNNLDKRGEK